mgnify:CR=1 FL=1
MASYFEGRGKYEHEVAVLEEEVTKLAGKDCAHLALFNGMKQMYDDGVVNRVRLANIAKKFKARAVLTYLRHRNAENLEKAMDEAILIAYNQCKTRREMRRLKRANRINQEVQRLKKLKSE